MRQSKSQNEAESMEFYIESVRGINEKYFEETKRRKTARINTFGCQMNVHDSEKLAGMLSSMGYATENEKEYADIVIYNTCCVRENAQNKFFGNLGILKGTKDIQMDVITVVCGCMTQQEAVVEKIKESYRNVDIIFGTFNLHRFPRLLYDNLQTNKMVIDVWEEHGEDCGELWAERSDPFKAYVNIMYGCDNFCSYCIVPYVRGRERSRPLADIVDEIKSLAAEGVKEITLLGQNVNSYGNNIPGDESFARLLRTINDIDGIERIRFMTSHPKDLSDEVILAMKECRKVCRHLHLPFQSGSTKVLGMMNRKYTKEDYLRLVEKVRENIPDISLTTDIIVGFPGEDENDFADTLDVVEKARFTSAYTFIYSKRAHTPAAAMESTATDDEIKRRFNQLLERVNDISAGINESLRGEKLDVLIESINEETGVLTGRTSGNSIVHINTQGIDKPEALIGKIIPVTITGSKTFYLNGEIENGKLL